MMKRRGGDDGDEDGDDNRDSDDGTTLAALPLPLLFLDLGQMVCGLDKIRSGDTVIAEKLHSVVWDLYTHL